MNTLELRKELIDKLSSINDVDFLNTIKSMIDSRKKERFIELTLEQEKELMESSLEGKNGMFISSSNMDEKVDEWLKEK